MADVPEIMRNFFCGFFSTKIKLNVFGDMNVADRTQGIANDTRNYINLQEQEIYLICCLWQRHIFLRM